MRRSVIAGSLALLLVSGCSSVDPNELKNESDLDAVRAEISKTKASEVTLYVAFDIQGAVPDSYDQSKPDLARTLYEQLITADKVDLLMGP